MFSNILKWTFKIAFGEVEKELNLHLDADTPLEVVEQVAFQMIAHCGKVKDAAKAQQEAQKVAEPVVSDKVEPIVDPAPVAIEGNEHA